VNVTKKKLRKRERERGKNTFARNKHNTKETEISHEKWTNPTKKVWT